MLLRMLIARTTKPDIAVRMRPLILERAFYRREGPSVSTTTSFELTPGRI